MASHLVLENAERDGDDAEFVLLKDGFVFFAFLVPFLWFLWHRMWIEAICALAVALAISALGTLAGLGLWASLASLLAGIFFGLEANALRAAALRRRGWREWGVAEADTAADAEIVYVKDRFGTESEASAAMPIADPGPRRITKPGGAEAPALGLIGYSTGR